MPFSLTSSFKSFAKIANHHQPQPIVARSGEASLKRCLNTKRAAMPQRLHAFLGSTSSQLRSHQPSASFYIETPGKQLACRAVLQLEQDDMLPWMLKDRERGSPGKALAQSLAKTYTVQLDIMPSPSEIEELAKKFTPSPWRARQIDNEGMRSWFTTTQQMLNGLDEEQRIVQLRYELSTYLSTAPQDLSQQPQLLDAIARLLPKDSAHGARLNDLACRQQALDILTKEYTQLGRNELCAALEKQRSTIQRGYLYEQCWALVGELTTIAQQRRQITQQPLGDSRSAKEKQFDERHVELLRQLRELDQQAKQLGGYPDESWCDPHAWMHYFKQVTITGRRPTLTQLIIDYQLAKHGKTIWDAYRQLLSDIGQTPDKLKHLLSLSGMTNALQATNTLATHYPEQIAQSAGDIVQSYQAIRNESNVPSTVQTILQRANMEKLARDVLLGHQTDYSFADAQHTIPLSVLALLDISHKMPDVVHALKGAMGLGVGAQMGINIMSAVADSNRLGLVMKVTGGMLGGFVESRFGRQIAQEISTNPTLSTAIPVAQKMHTMLHDPQRNAGMVPVISSAATTVSTIKARRDLGSIYRAFVERSYNDIGLKGYLKQFAVFWKHMPMIAKTATVAMLATTAVGFTSASLLFFGLGFWGVASAIATTVVATGLAVRSIEHFYAWLERVDSVLNFGIKQASREARAELEQNAEL